MPIYAKAGFKKRIIVIFLAPYAIFLFAQGRPVEELQHPESTLFVLTPKALFSILSVVQKVILRGIAFHSRKERLMELKNILFEKKDFLAWITLNRPEVRNAQNDTLRAEVIWALEDSRDDDNVRIIIITGAGDKAFSAGADISEFPKRMPADILRGKGIKRMTDLVREIPKPAIAMVNGLALGGGCELAMACDIIIASENAQFGQPEINIGIIPGAGGTQILPRLVGEKKAKEMVFTGGFIPAQEALALRLINRVVPQEKLRETVMEMAKAILRHSPIILKLCKLAINKSLDVPLTVGMDYERDLFAICFGTEDQKEGSKAFLEKRKPEYKGR